MSAKSEQVGIKVFTRYRDICAMEYFRDTYAKIFSNEAMLEQHREIPLQLDIQRVSSRSLFFGKRVSGHLPCLLREKDFVSVDQIPSRFTIDSPILSQVHRMLRQTNQYVKKREEKFFYRRGWHPFSDLRDPRYYVISMLQQRLLVLCTLSDKPEALLTEFDRLKAFLLSIIDACTESKYFPNSMSKRFQRLLDTMIKFVEDIENNLSDYKSKMSLRPKLLNIVRILNNARPIVAEKLALSTCNLNQDNVVSTIEPISLQQPKLLRQPYLESIYHQIYGDRGPVKIKQLSELGLGAVTEHLNSEEKSTYLNCVNNLLALLHGMRQYACYLDTLSEQLEWHGSRQLFGQPRLELIIRRSLELSSLLFKRYDSWQKTLCSLGRKIVEQSYDQTKDFKRNLNQVMRTKSDVAHYFNQLSTARQSFYDTLQIQLQNYRDFDDERMIVEDNELVRKTCDSYRQFLLELEAHALLTSRELNDLVIDLPEFSEKLCSQAVPLDLASVPSQECSAPVWRSSISPWSAVITFVEAKWLMLDAELSEIKEKCELIDQLAQLGLQENFSLSTAAQAKQLLAELDTFELTQAAENPAECQDSAIRIKTTLAEGLKLYRKHLKEEMSKTGMSKTDQQALEDIMHKRLMPKLQAIDAMQQRCVELVSPFKSHNPSKVLQERIKLRQQGLSSHNTRIVEYGQQLFEAKTAEQGREILRCFVQALAQPKYRLFLAKGTVYTDAGGCSYQLPRHVVAMLMIYQNNQANATDLAAYRHIAWSMFALAKQASISKHYAWFNWFGTRHRSTQLLYQQLAATSDRLGLSCA